MKTKLEILILLKCSRGLLQKKYISQYYARYSASERQKAVDNLIADELISLVLLPKSDTRKSPTFFEITDKGKKWLIEYESKYPKK